jgi:hypothetical protein
MLYGSYYMGSLRGTLTSSRVKWKYLVIDGLGGTRTRLHSTETKTIMSVLSSLIYSRMTDSVIFQSSMARSPSCDSTLERLLLQTVA